MPPRLPAPRRVPPEVLHEVEDGIDWDPSRSTDVDLLKVTRTQQLVDLGSADREHPRGLHHGQQQGSGFGVGFGLRVSRVSFPGGEAARVCMTEGWLGTALGEVARVSAIRVSPVVRCSVRVVVDRGLDMGVVVHALLGRLLGQNLSAYASLF